jgi:hypothetical protein
LCGKPERKRPFGRPRLRREDNIRMDLTEIWWEAVDWIIRLRTGIGGGLSYVVMSLLVP